MARASRKTSTPRTNILTMPMPESVPPDGREDIARRAYEIFLARGAGHGSDMDDWLTAEQELRSADSSAIATRSAGKKRA